MAAAVRDEVGLNTLSMHAGYGQKLVAILADSDIPNYVVHRRHTHSHSHRLCRIGHSHRHRHRHSIDIFRRCLDIAFLDLVPNLDLVLVT